MVRAKICGLTHAEDARAADEAGAAYLGVVLSRGFGRSVTVAEGAALLTGVRAERVAVLVNEPVDVAEQMARTIGAGVIQLHGEENEAVATALRSRGPWRIWKSVRARALEDVLETVRRFEGLVDGILVEGWKEGVVGGGGVALAVPPNEVRAAVPATLDLVLAGGLRADNVRQAAALFRPEVVDVSSGVEGGPRRKDPERVRAFLREVAAAADLPGPPDHMSVPGGRSG